MMNSDVIPEQSPCQINIESNLGFGPKMKVCYFDMHYFKAMTLFDAQKTCMKQTDLSHEVIREIIQKKPRGKPQGFVRI
jgi:hypothetical protein